mgnify:CR=1 FL=1
MDYKLAFFILIGIIGFLIISSLVGVPILFWYISGIVYKNTALPTKTHDWGRHCSDPGDYEMMVMWEQGLQWEKENHQCKKEVKIHNDGCDLVGEYFDFGSDKTVILIAGRLESLMYSYYFAEPFKKANLNVLCIDKRGHGLSSGGEVEDFGQVGWVDIIAWAKFIHEEYHCNDITLHGICIGGTAGVYAISNEECPTYIKRIIVDSLYKNLYNNFYFHMKQERRPTFLITRFIMKRIGKVHHQDYINDGPYKQIKKVKKPILFIYSQEDVFAPPEDAKIVMDNCASEHKKIALFPTGRHSHVRINHQEEYDKAIIDFLKQENN